MSSFLHAGTFGDTIYGLNVIKLLGGGDLYLELNGMDAVSYRAWRSPNAGDHAGRYTQADIDFIMPLLEVQPYISNAKVWDNDQVTFDLRDHYKYVADLEGGARTGKWENWRGNQTQCYAMLCGLDVKENERALLLDPWLTVTDPIVIPGKPIVINRTPRHIKRELAGSPINEQWASWIADNHLEETAVFVGSKAEHEAFCKLHDCQIEYYPVKDMLQLARVIAGCEQFIGNQSMPLSLAIGLGKTFWCEVRLDYENLVTPYGYGDVWFPRANGHYF